MSKLLASVIDHQEMELAINSGADIIDLKNPHRGALGALSIDTISSLVVQCRGRCPVSATVGDLPAEPLQLTQAIDQTARCGVDYVKVGFFSNDNLTECIQAIKTLTNQYAVVAVLFADLQPPLHQLNSFASAGFKGVMLDTAGKGGGGLLSHIGLEEIDHFVDECRSLGLLNGLAGSLSLDDIPKLLPIMPDYLGFRGALCDQAERTAGIVPHRLNDIRNAFSLYSPPVEQQSNLTEVNCGD
ncbi:MAG: (5-formylfuran-3-yl)methyl phosphate synthase [Candidatus Thiodiazotropha sp. DIVDIV]